MITARKSLRILCTALCVCIIFAFVSCSKSEDTSSYIETSDLSEVSDTSDEISSTEASDVSREETSENSDHSDISSQEKDLVFTLTETLGTKCYAVSGFNGDESVLHIDIPSHVKGLPVMIIDYGAFFGRNGLRSITIPDTVISIHELAFFGCAGLTSITIPESVSFIGEYAFSGCTGLTSITIPSQVRLITKGVFGGCTGLESMTVSPENEIYHSAGNCIIESQTNTLIVGCKSSVIPTDGSVTSIGAEAFDGCIGLTDITIPDSVTVIGEYAFTECSGLTSITIPDSVISIGEYAFTKCSGLTSITVPDSVISIGEGMISYCDNLERITVLPENKNYHSAGNCIVETKTRMLVAGCKTSVIPTDGSVTGIGADAFSGSNFTSIAVPDKILYIGEGAFKGCSDIANITIPSSVINISSRAFQNCTGLTGIIIPCSVTNIGEGAFWGCTGLESMTVSPENETYNSVGNCIIESKTNTLIAGCKSTVIPTDGSVTNIGAEAFSECTGLTSITVPDGVISIGEYAFAHCKNLTSITIPSSVTEIEWGAFHDCAGLTNITFGGIISQWKAFRHSLRNVVVHCADGDAIYDNEGETNYIEYPGMTEYSASFVFTLKETNGTPFYAVSEYLQKEEIIGVSIPAYIKNIPVTEIGYRVFDGCRGLTNITIPNSVTNIEEMAFAGCVSLTVLSIPESVTNITAGAFAGCTGLESITVSPENKTYYSAGNCIIETTSKTLIAGCKNTVIPNDGSVTEIGAYAFSGSNITNVIIPDNITAIGYRAFLGNPNLTSISIPGSVTSIDSEAFIPSAINSVTFGGTKAQWQKFHCIFSEGAIVHCTDGDITY